MSEVSGKWSYSCDEEQYHGQFDTMDEAIAEGSLHAGRELWVGKCVRPEQPEDIFCLDDWLEHVWCHEDYRGDWAEGSFEPSKRQCDELQEEIRNAIAAWIDRHKLRPMHWIIDPKSIRKIEVSDE